MKFLKNSFSLLVALATVGITLMSHTSLLKPKKSWEPSGCYKPNITLKYSCNGPDVDLTTTTDCEYSRYFANGNHVFNINPNDYIILAEVPEECWGGDSFCCATVISDQTWWGDLQPPCPGQPYFTLEGINNQYEIDEVYCKID